MKRRKLWVVKTHSEKLEDAVFVVRASDPKEAVKAVAEHIGTEAILIERENDNGEFYALVADDFKKEYFRREAMINDLRGAEYLGCVRWWRLVEDVWQSKVLEGK